MTEKTWACDSEVPHRARDCRDCRRVYRARYLATHAEHNREQQRQWRLDHPEKTYGYTKKYRAKNREKVAGWSRGWRERNPEKLKVVNKRSNLKKIGWTFEEWQKAHALQRGQCAICGREGQLDADHCHSSMRPRHLLCAPCNRSLAWFADDERVLWAALAYLAIAREVELGD